MSSLSGVAIIKTKRIIRISPVVNEPIERMSTTQFVQLGQKITGVKYGYQLPLAYKLGVCLRQVKRYASGECKITPTIELLMKELDK